MTIPALPPCFGGGRGRDGGGPRLFVPGGAPVSLVLVRDSPVFELLFDLARRAFDASDSSLVFEGFRVRFLVFRSSDIFVAFSRLRAQPWSLVQTHDGAKECRGW